MDVTEVFHGFAVHHHERLHTAPNAGKDALGIARDWLQMKHTYFLLRQKSMLCGGIVTSVLVKARATTYCENMRLSQDLGSLTKPPRLKLMGKAQNNSLLLPQRKAPVNIEWEIQRVKSPCYYPAPYNYNRSSEHCLRFHPQGKNFSQRGEQLERVIKTIKA